MKVILTEPIGIVKGFFRRSIQQKIQYRPCTKNQQCSILRINRNRCQYCRLKKCIAVGMSRDAVRFGRVPKREKAKILAAMQKVNAHSLEKALSVLLEDENSLMQSIIKAHGETCDFTKDKVVPLLENARARPIYAQCPQMTCPLNPLPSNTVTDGTGSITSNRLMEDFSERFSPAIHGVVEFAKRIPGFSMLAQEDQVTLLKAGVFEVLLVRLACMFDSQSNLMICLNGLILRRDSLQSASNARFLLDSMFEFAERLNSLNLSDQEIALFCAVVVIAPDRPGLRNVDLVQKINKRLEEVLQKVIASNHPEDSTSSIKLFTELTKKIPDLRTLNALHSEKLLGKNFNSVDSTAADSASQMENSLHSNDSIISTTKMTKHSSHMLPDSQIESPDRWSSSSSSSLFHSQPSPSNSTIDNDRRSASPNSHQDLWIDVNLSKENGPSNFGSPRSMSSGISSDDSSGLSRKLSISLASKLPYLPSYGYNNLSSIVPVSNSSLVTESSSVSPNESSSIVYNQNSINQHSRLHCFVKSPRMDSPTDSGMDSGKEHCNASTPATSVCSSPQSAIEDSNNRSSFNNKESLVSAEKHETIDDMPVLKRALQAPPLVNTNKLMDEAYRYHKKFRAARRDTEPHSPTTTTRSSSNNDQSIQSNCNAVGVIHSAPVATITSMTSSSSSSSSQSPSASILASAHSTLLKTLEQPSRYMNEQQLKRTDLIHNIIMNTEAVNAPATAAPMMIADNLNISSQYYQDNHRHSYNSSENCPYSGSSAPRAEKFAQISIMLSPDESHHHSYSNHIHSSGTNTFSNGRFATESSLPNSNCLSDHHHHQAITPTSGQQFLVIGRPTTLPAHSPRPSSTFSSTYSNHQPPYSHLHRCLTATVAPALATNGPIILQAASNTTNSPSSKIHSTEFDCQPLNLSKKASPLSTIVSTISSSPLSSSTQ
ncbi:hypothetical protein NH340_JMT01058 [Sarcoptes scabiei]|nr:hypothetical protein NH340_JMT01058 [Sarcoptes scabiei]